MAKKTKSNRALVILAAIVFVLMFGWFQVRPSIIRISCYNFVKARFSGEKSVKPDEINLSYRVCLASKGLKAEDLFSK